MGYLMYNTINKLQGGEKMKIAVIGAGAAGLIASVIIKRTNHELALYEKQPRAARKLIATGNGRCNLTNIDINLSRYHGDRDFASYALDTFNQYSLMDFMEEMGVKCVYEGDKVFPYSLQASSVADMLRLAEGECEICNTEVKKLKVYKNKIGVITDDKEEKYDRVIVCCGGKAASKLSGGGAYNLLTDLGHTLTPLKPSIVQLKCKNTKALEGIKVNALVKMDKRQEMGEVLFTSYGLSGPPILQLSRDAKGKKIDLDLTPDLSFKEVEEFLVKKKKVKNLTLANLFTGFLNKKVGREILKICNVLPFSKSCSEITNHEIKSPASKVKCLSFEIDDTNGFENAQVTAGGILCSEFNPLTMESKKVKGLYAAGEMLDVDGDCGGFNLQWAFSSGYIAAINAIKED